MDTLHKLRALILEKSVKTGDFTLSSGKKSNFYVDLKRTTLDGTGALLTGRGLFEKIKTIESQENIKFQFAGGLTLGADPMATAVSCVSALEDRPISSFIVRKETKGHGTQSQIEGLSFAKTSAEILVLEDVITSGASSLVAIQALRAAGFSPKYCLAILDRQEGGEAALAAAGVKVFSLFTKSSLV